MVYSNVSLLIVEISSLAPMASSDYGERDHGSGKVTAGPRRHKTWAVLGIELCVFVSLLLILVWVNPGPVLSSGVGQTTKRSRVHRVRLYEQEVVAELADVVESTTRPSRAAATKLANVDTDEWTESDGEDQDENDSEESLDEADEDLYDQNATAIPYRGDYRELFSLTTRNRKFYPIHMDGIWVYNANLIPHPVRADEWVVVASHPGLSSSEALYCSLGNLNDVLVCSSEPRQMTPAPSIKSEKCLDGKEYLNFYTGPRDVRMFYGPDKPYVLYGSQSTWTCLGLWIQDARSLLDVFHIIESVGNKLFKQSTELHRPPPVNPIEKNFFVFWASDGKAYAHYDVYPARSFAQINIDGTVSNDLAPAAAKKDKFCMAKYMPVPLSKMEGIHQATNSLSITLCKRGACQPSDDNTFIMHIIQHKTFYDYHSVYEPYLVLFRQTAPFELYAISQKPFWIHGRSKLSKETHAREYESHPEKVMPEGHTELFYLTSMSWKKHGRTYHGHVDDEIWLSFGIEDSRAAAMDVLAGDLLEDLAYC